MRFAAAIVMILAAGLNANGQADSLIIKEKPVRYFFTINSGILFCNDCNSIPTPAPTTIHGVELFKRWRIGGGIGFTGLRDVNVMPYFGSISFDMPGKKKKWGTYVEWNFGGGMAWPMGGADPYMQQSLDYATMPAFHQISTGYYFRYHKLRLAAFIGYQKAKTIVKYTYGDPYEYDGPIYDYIMPPSSSRIENISKRLLVGISVGI